MRRIPKVLVLDISGFFHTTPSLEVNMLSFGEFEDYEQVHLRSTQRLSGPLKSFDVYESGMRVSNPK